MPPQKNEQLLRRYVNEVLNKGNMDVYDELVDNNVVENGPDFSDLGLPGDSNSREGAKQGLRALREAAPDVQYTIRNVNAQGEQVEFEWTARGRHSGGRRIMGKDASNKQASVSGRATVRFANDKIVESTAEWDPEDLRRQLS